MSKTLLIIAVAAVAAALVFLLVRNPGELAPVRPARPAHVEAPERSPEPAGEAAVEAARSEVAAAALQARDDAQPTEPAQAAPPVVAGRVIDVEGRAIAGALVTTEPRIEGVEAPLLSDAEGRFTLPAAPDDRMTWVHARRAGYAEVLAGTLFVDSRAVDLVLAPAISVGGRVVDTDGHPVAGASVRFSAGEAWRASLSRALESARDVWLQQTADTSGAFLFDQVPLVPGARLFAQSERLRSDVVPCPQQSDLEVVLTVRGEMLYGELVRGRVLDPDGAPAEGAWVACGLAAATSAADGSFALVRAELEAGLPIRAVKEGSLPARLEPPAAAGAGEAGWPETIELRLGGPALAISGQVLDEDGRPLAGREVWIENPSVFGPANNWLSHVEALLAGERGSTTFVTDARGTFRVEGLLDRRYDLAAVDIETLRVARAVGVLAGTDGLLLRMPAPDEASHLAGRVVDSSGAPLSDVEVTAGILVRSWEWPGSRSGPSNEYVYGPGARTDARGGFRIDGVTPDVDRLRLAGDALLPCTRTIEPDSDRSALVVEVEARRQLQVEVAGRFTEAVEFMVLDAQGRELQLYLFSGQGYSRSPRGALFEGRSPVLVVSERGRTLVLRDALRQELHRRELDLPAEEVGLVRID